jgi:hypothetical protein
VLESNKELTEMLEELSRVKSDAECQYDLEDFSIDVGCQTVVDQVSLGCQVVVEMVNSTFQSESCGMASSYCQTDLVSSLCQIDSTTPLPQIDSSNPLPVNEIPNPSTPKPSASTQSDYIDDPESYLNPKSFLCLEEISEVWQETEIPNLKHQLDLVLKSTMATRGYLVDRGHFDKEIERWFENVKKEIGENEFLVRRVQDGLDKEIERNFGLRERIMQHVQDTDDVKELGHSATQTFTDSTTIGIQACDDLGLNSYQPKSFQQEFIQPHQENVKTFKPLSMLFSVGVVIAALISWQTSTVFSSRKNITLI